MSDKQLTLAGPVASGETFEATGIWLSVMRLVNTLDDRATLYLKGDTLPPGSPEWDTHARTIPAVIQQVEVPVPANGAVETGVMIVPDPGSSLAVDHGHRIALPPPRDGELPTRAATQYATIRNTRDAATTVSLIYTYQQETFNPGRGDFLGAEMGRLRLGFGGQFRLGGSLSGVIDGQSLGWTLLELDLTGTRPALLRDPSEDEDDFFIYNAGEFDIRIRYGTPAQDFEIPDGWEDGPKAWQVGYGLPTVGQTILTDRVGGDVQSSFSYRFRPIVGVDASIGLDAPVDAFEQADPFGDIEWEYRGRERVGSELTDWADPDAFSIGDSRLRVGDFGRNLDWYYDTSWIAGPREDLDEQGEKSESIFSWQGWERGCLWWIIAATFAFGGALGLWLLFGGGPDETGLESLTLPLTETTSTTTILADEADPPADEPEVVLKGGFGALSLGWVINNLKAGQAYNYETGSFLYANPAGDLTSFVVQLDGNRLLVGVEGVLPSSLAFEIFQENMERDGCGDPADRRATAFISGVLYPLVITPEGLAVCIVPYDPFAEAIFYAYGDPGDGRDDSLGDWSFSFGPDSPWGDITITPTETGANLEFPGLNALPVVGDFDGDGVDDVGWWAPVTN